MTRNRLNARNLDAWTRLNAYRASVLLLGLQLTDDVTHRYFACSFRFIATCDGPRVVARRQLTYFSVSFVGAAC